MTQQYFKKLMVVLDEEKKEKKISPLQKMINSLNAKFNRGRKPKADKLIRQLQSIDLSSLDLGDAFLIDPSSLNFSLLDSLALSRQQEESDKYYLMRDFEKLIELLSSYVEEPRKTIEVEITLEVPKPKTLKKVTTYEKISIFERWVKIGYKMYRRHFNVFTGDEYIVVDGDAYYIKTNRYGEEYLA